MILHLILKIKCKYILKINYNFTHVLLKLGVKYIALVIKKISAPRVWSLMMCCIRKGSCLVTLVEDEKNKSHILRINHYEDWIFKTYDVGQSLGQGQLYLLIFF